MAEDTKRNIDLEKVYQVLQTALIYNYSSTWYFSHPAVLFSLSLQLQYCIVSAFDRTREALLQHLYKYNEFYQVLVKNHSLQARTMREEMYHLFTMDLAPTNNGSMV